MKHQSRDVNKMMKKTAVKREAVYTVDLTKIDGDGAFPCPKCGTMISPEDESEELYKIVDTKIVNEELVELVVMCGNCGSTIKLAGFEQTIDDIPDE